MTLEYELVGSDNDAEVYWNDELLTTATNERPPGITSKDGVPTDPDVRGAIVEWLAQQDIPNDLGYSDAIMMCISLEAGDITERNAQ